MRKFILACIVGVSVGLFPARAWCSPEGIADLVRLAQAGLSEEVLVAFVEASDVAYDFTADEIVYLKDNGISEKVILAAITRGKMLRELAAAAGEAPTAPAAAPAPAEAPAPEAAASAAETATAPVYTYQEPAASVPALLEAGTLGEIGVAPYPVTVSPPSTVITYSYFYEYLNPYGSWLLVDDAWMWRPTVALTVPYWRPYFSAGRWIFTDCGWAWVSDYSWGWAPFHYGRWWRHRRHGWLWAPGRTWAPAWVIWRRSPSYCGWAPLPHGADYHVGIGFTFRGSRVGVDFDFGLGSDDYCFVPEAQFCSTSLLRHRLPPAEVTNIYNRTTVIQNNYIYQDNRIINTGPSVADISRSLGRPIRPVAIRDERPEPGRPFRSHRLEGDNLVVLRPAVEPQTPEAPPAIHARLLDLSRRAAEARRTQTRTDIPRPQGAPATWTRPRTPAGEPGSPIRPPGSTTPQARQGLGRPGDEARDTTRPGPEPRVVPPAPSKKDTPGAEPKRPFPRPGAAEEAPAAPKPGPTPPGAGSEPARPEREVPKRGRGSSENQPAPPAADQAARAAAQEEARRQAAQEAVQAAAEDRARQRAAEDAARADQARRDAAQEAIRAAAERSRREAAQEAIRAAAEERTRQRAAEDAARADQARRDAAQDAIRAAADRARQRAAEESARAPAQESRGERPAPVFSRREVAPPPTPPTPPAPTVGWRQPPTEPSGAADTEEDSSRYRRDEDRRRGR